MKTTTSLTTALLLLVLSTSVWAQGFPNAPGEGSWVAGPSPVGPPTCTGWLPCFGGIQTRICIAVWTGVTSTVVTQYERECTPVTEFDQFVWLSPGGPVFIPMPVVTGFVYRNVPIGSTEFFTPVVVTTTYAEFRLCGSGCGCSQSSSASSTTTDSLLNNDPNVTETRIDRRVVPQGVNLQMCHLEPGLHLLEMDSLVNGNLVTHATDLTVNQELQLVQIEDPSTELAIPTAAFEFTNNSANPVDIDLQVIPVEPGLVTYLSGNLVHLEPGDTIQRVVEFANADGFAVPDGAPLNAIVNAHVFGPFGDILASVELHAASKAASLGSGEDLELTSVVGDNTLAHLSTKTGEVGDNVVVHVWSPLDTFTNGNCGIFIDSFTLPAPLTPRFSAFPAYRLSANATSLLTVANLPTGGISTSIPLLPQMSGTVMRVQGIAVDAGAANGVFATTAAHDFFIP